MDFKATQVYVFLHRQWLAFLLPHGSMLELPTLHSAPAALLLELGREEVLDAEVWDLLLVEEETDALLALSPTTVLVLSLPNALKPSNVII